MTPVKVATAVKGALPSQLVAIGTVYADETVTVRPQVDGRVEAIGFTDGAEVEAGALLFQLDARPARAALREAEAALEREEAARRLARVERGRYQELHERGYVSAQQYQEVSTRAVSSDAAVREARARVASARLVLGYATLRAKIGGRAGRALVEVGDVVKENDTALVVLQRIAPATVRFAVPEDRLSEVRAGLAQGPLRVEVREATGETLKGELSFVDNQIDRGTGTVLLEARFANQARSLWPGELVEVTLTLRREQGILLPARALTRGPDAAPQVFVVGPDQRVHRRQVRVALQTGEQVLLSEGVRAGEVAVVEGHLGLGPGAQVVVKQDPAAAAKESAGGLDPDPP